MKNITFDDRPLTEQRMGNIPRAGSKTPLKSSLKPSRPGTRQVGTSIHRPITFFFFLRRICFASVLMFQFTFDTFVVNGISGQSGC